MSLSVCTPSVALFFCWRFKFASIRQFAPCATPHRHPMNLLVTATIVAVVAADLRTSIDQGFAQLYDSYNWTTGMFVTDDEVAFWTTANAFETTANYIIHTGAEAPPGHTQSFAQFIDNSLKVLQSALFTDAFRDDHLWYTLAFARLYQATGNTSYLNVSTTIFSDLVGPWHAWNTTCGGMNWDKTVPYVNAITNELFLSAAMRLHALVPGNPTISNFTYLEWAIHEWSWLNSTVMLQQQPQLFQDGLSEMNCSQISPGGSFWTYNQGVLLSGLSELSVTTGQDNLAAFAGQVATNAFAYFSAGAPSSYALQELSCGADG